VVWELRPQENNVHEEDTHIKTEAISMSRNVQIAV
jgi:hypothetical protein